MAIAMTILIRIKIELARYSLLFTFLMMKFIANMMIVAMVIMSQLVGVATGITMIAAQTIGATIRLNLQISLRPAGPIIDGNMIDVVAAIKKGVVIILQYPR